jgi:hypothetical protein
MRAARPRTGSSLINLVVHRPSLHFLGRRRQIVELFFNTDRQATQEPRARGQYFWLASPCLARTPAEAAQAWAAARSDAIRR